MFGWSKNDHRREHVYFDPRGRAFALFLRPHPGAFRQLMCPHPGECAHFFKNNANARGLARGEGGGGGLSTAGID